MEPDLPPTKTIRIESLTIGGANPLVLIAGPCVIEGRDMCLQIAEELKRVAAKAGVGLIFKSSFDKANRLSRNSFRGPGIEEGLQILALVKAETDLPILTDIHETWQASVVGQVVDVIQIPAFLCRQTDLVTAAAEAGKPVNLKKGQFMSPWDMRNIVEKVTATGNHDVILTERGFSFGYGSLVADMRSLAVMRSFGYPVVFDATHSVAQPGGQGNHSGGQREFVPQLARAAAAVGIDGLFVETHPNPDKALSDAATMWPLGEMANLVRQVKAIDGALKSGVGAGNRR
jgi:2-dehydro-3-deoxyphosphooctonate aldolase (KDO 8-P synthase)